MNPSIINRVETDTTLSFTLENADVSIANALRRVILSEIDTVVFKTTPHSQNKTNIIVNIYTTFTILMITAFTSKILEKENRGPPNYATNFNINNII